MRNKLRSVTIRVEPELWDRVVARAREDRRPVAQLLRILVADAIAEFRPADVGAIHA
jgi:hypothetical protein